MLMNRYLIRQALLVALEVLMDGGGPVVRVKVDEGSDTVDAVRVEGLPTNGNNNVLIIHLHTIVTLVPAGTGGLERLPKTWVAIQWHQNGCMSDRSMCKYGKTCKSKSASMRLVCEQNGHQVEAEMATHEEFLSAFNAI